LLLLLLLLLVIMMVSNAGCNPGSEVGQILKVQ
jgi:hypothetical protein